uniref:uncharacterized protein LOC120335565 n=1 Tax=Styela clava TaxID=7725 RepID=UPI001939E544|nr:uncharacterized protein LOC120335565 [Styela clava]
MNTAFVMILLFLGSVSSAPTRGMKNNFGHIIAVLSDLDAECRGCANKATCCEMAIQVHADGDLQTCADSATNDEELGGCFQHAYDSYGVTGGKRLLAKIKGCHKDNHALKCVGVHHDHSKHVH